MSDSPQVSSPRSSPPVVRSRNWQVTDILFRVGRQKGLAPYSMPLVASAVRADDDVFFIIYVV